MTQEPPPTPPPLGTEPTPTRETPRYRSVPFRMDARFRNSFQPSREVVGISAAFAAVAVFGTTFPALAELSHYPLATGQAMRNGLAAVILFSFRRRRPPFRRQELPRLLALVVSGPVGVSALVLAAERSTDPASVGIIVGCVPLVTALCAPLAAGRRVQPRLVVCAAIAVFGAILVQSAGARVTTVGLAFAVGALWSEVAFISLGGPLYQRHGALAVTPWLCVGALAIFLIGGSAIDAGRLVQPLTTRDELAIAYLGISAIISMLCWGVGLARLEPERFGLCLAAVPIAALLTSAAVGVSELTVLRTAGCLVVAVAIGAGLWTGSTAIGTG